MASTALDFREMMRKERELAMKKLAATPSSPKARHRYMSKRRTRLDLKRNHRVSAEGAERGIDGIFYVPGFVTEEEGRGLELAARSGDGGSGGGGGGGEWKDLYKRRLQIHGGTPHPSGMVEEELPAFLQEVCDALVEAGVFPESSPPNHVLLNEYSDGQGIGPHKDGPLYEGRVAILSLGKEAFLDFWGSLEDAKADCADIAAGATSGRAICAVPVSGLAAGDAFTSSSEDNSVFTDESATDDADGRAHQRRRAAKRALVSVKCEHCSLVVFEGKAYREAWHGIASTAGSGATMSATEAAPPARTEAEVATSGNISTIDDCVAAPQGADEVAPSFSGTVKGGDLGGVGEAAQKRLSFTIRRVARVVPADSVMEHSEARSEMERRRRGFERSVTETGGDAGTSTAAAAAAAAAAGKG
ncbi:conserved unknown protein [Ectocarpus siliculosus]|uniref:Alpha-ketoglutarate-dependent dioxygenase AlkB-like domain-containing protein n=1 Tax=Ectocarpus siliculosus TaxID=2880 RepID=D8LIK0_ECTSI|nr:conserved unknown protein [Ectocarpus siliculosus]|eukprot:CBN80039.1 conserved unknown protein [Ectocarpus siliculosus]